MAGRHGRLRRQTLLTVVAVLAACVTAHTQADLTASRSARVRPLDAHTRVLVARAVAASPTVAGLLQALDASDMLIYVEVTLDVRYAGNLRFAGRSGRARVLRVRISAAQSPQEQIAVLGHELQHAREVAEAPGVQDEAGLAALMDRIGRSTGRGTFETQAAVLVARRVRGEIALAAPGRSATSSVVNSAGTRGERR